MSDFIYQLSEDSDFLMHHGIKGQKWGVENGPPYPLDRRTVLKDIDNAIRQSKKEDKTGHKIYDTNVAKRLSITSKEIQDIQKEYSKLSKEIDDYIGINTRSFNISNKGKQLIKKWDKSDGDIDKFIKQNLPKLSQYKNRFNELNQKNIDIVDSMLKDFGNIPIRSVSKIDSKDPVTVNSLFQTKNRGETMFDMMDYIGSNNDMKLILNNVSEYLWETSDY